MEYCSVRLELKAPENLDPAESFNGEVTFTPDIARGDVWNNGGSLTPSVRVDAYIVDNNLQGSDGKKLVTLFAGGPGVNPEQVYWRIAFDDLYVGNQRVHIDPFVFEAIPGAVLDLAEVTPVAGYTPPGIIRGLKGEPGLSFKGVFNDESELPLYSEKGDAWVNLSSKDLYIWDGSKWEVLSNFARVDANVENIESLIAEAKAHEANAKTYSESSDVSKGLSYEYSLLAKRYADETAQQVSGDFATKAYVDGSVADASHVKRFLTTSDSLDILTNGIYPVPTSSVAGPLGLPEGLQGWLQHIDLDGSRLHRRQYYRTDARGKASKLYRRTYYNGSWDSFSPVDEQTPYIRGGVSGDIHIDQLTGSAYEGLWTYSSSNAISWGLPERSSGILEIVSSGLSTIQEIRTLTTPIKTYQRRWYNGNWSGDWENKSGGGTSTSSDYYKGAIPSGSKPEDLTKSEHQGLWTYSSGQVKDWSIPSLAGGFLEVKSTGTSVYQEATTLTTPIKKYHRRWYNGTWSGDWAEFGSGGSSQPEPDQPQESEYDVATSKSAINLLIPSVLDPTLSYEEDHAALVSDLKVREGAVVTKGKAAVALVADHGTTVFKEWMWEEAKSRNIPFTMALAPEIHLDGRGDSRHTASNDDIKQWVSEGLVIASHSGDHGGALGYFDVSRQIKTSKEKLEEKLETSVDCWVQPGYALALGNYDGFGTGQSASRYTDYYAGRMLQQNYAVVTGYVGDDFVYPGDQDLPVGVRRSLTERKDNQADVISTIESAIATGGKHINFCHPYAITNSSNTYVTKSEYIEYLDWLASKRDAGDLVLLTLPQLFVSRNTLPVVFERGDADWTITSEPDPDWVRWTAGRIYPPAGRHFVELSAGATAELRPSATGTTIVSGSVVDVQPGDHILGMYSKQGHKIMVTPL